MTPSTSEATLEKQAAQKRKFSWKILPMLAITGLICAVLVHQFSDTEQFIAALNRVRWYQLLVPVGLMSISLILSAIRWRIILSAMGIQLPMMRAMDVILSTWPFALITPSRASDLLRAFAIRDLLPVVEGSSSVVAEKLVDVQSLCILGILGSLWLGMWPLALLIFGMLFCEWSVALLLLRYHRKLASHKSLVRFEGKIIKLFQAFNALKKSPRHFFLLSFTSLVSWLLALSIIDYLSGIFGATLDSIQVIALWPVSIFVGMLPLTVAGMGTRDAAFMSLLKLTSATPVNEGAVLAATFSYAIITAWLPALMGLPLMLRQMHRLSLKRST